MSSPEEDPFGSLKVPSEPVPPAKQAAPKKAPAAPAPKPAASPLPPGETLPDRLLHVLRTQPEPLFALLDAARNPRVRPLLQESGQEHQSLYEGTEGEVLADFAPYLLSLSPQSALLEVL